MEIFQIIVYNKFNHAFNLFENRLLPAGLRFDVQDPLQPENAAFT